jgi:hypothetical protein
LLDDGWIVILAMVLRRSQLGLAVLLTLSWLL